MLLAGAPVRLRSNSLAIAAQRTRVTLDGPWNLAGSTWGIGRILHLGAGPLQLGRLGGGDGSIPDYGTNLGNTPPVKS